MSQLEDIRDNLLAAKRAGIPFDEAWADAVPCVDVALDATREAWRRAYTDEPATKPDRAAARMFVNLPEPGDRTIVAA